MRGRAVTSAQFRWPVGKFGTAYVSGSAHRPLQGVDRSGRWQTASAAIPEMYKLPGYPT